MMNTASIQRRCEVHNHLQQYYMKVIQQQNITIWSSTVKDRRRRARGAPDRNIFAPSGRLPRDRRDDEEQERDGFGDVLL